MLLHLRNECSEMAKQNTDCHDCKASHRGPTSRTLRKTVSLLRRLSGAKKHGRKPSVGGQTPQKRVKVNGPDDIEDSNPMVPEWSLPLTSQDIHSACQAICELEGTFSIAELPCMPPDEYLNEQQFERRLSTQVDSLLQDYSPTSSVACSQTSQSMCTTLSSPLYGQYNYSSLFDKSPISTAPTSATSPFPLLDITTTPGGPVLLKPIQNDYLLHADQTSWLSDDENACTFYQGQNLNEIPALHSPAHVFNIRRGHVSDTEFTVSNNSQVYSWPLPNPHQHLPIRTHAAPTECLFGEIRSSIGSADRVRRFLGSNSTQLAQTLATTAEKDYSTTATSKDSLQLSVNTFLSRRNAVRNGKSVDADGSSLSDMTANETDRCTFPGCGYQPKGAKNRAGRLKRHRMTHENLERIPCPRPGCSASFTAGRNDNLRSHLTYRHQIPQSELKAVLVSENTSVASGDSQEGCRLGGAMPVITRHLQDGSDDSSLWRDIGSGTLSAIDASAGATDQERDILETAGETSRPSDIGPTGWNAPEWQFPSR